MSMLNFVQVSKDAKKRIDSEANEMAQRLVRDAAEAMSPKCGNYARYTPEQRFEIGKFASEFGTPKAVRKYTTRDRKINESTIRGFKKLYYQQLTESKKRKRDGEISDVESEISMLTPKKRGRKLLLGDELDLQVQNFVRGLRESGGVINSCIVRSAAKGIVMTKCRNSLIEHGGHIDLTKAWSHSLLSRMNFVKRKGTTSKKTLNVENFDQVKCKYLTNIKNCMEKHNIPQKLVINWDQTGLHVVPVSKWTLAEQGSKRVEITGLEDKRQITGTLAGTMSGDFLPMQMIYGGKTDMCHPKFDFPKSFHITHSENHWANSETMKDYVCKIIVPYVDNIKFEKDLPLGQKALVIFDCFRGQITEEFRELLTKHRLTYVTVPPNCTDKLQPMDLSVNKCAKDFLKSKFEAYYSEEVAQQQKGGKQLDRISVDLSLTKLKPMGAKWLTELYDYLKRRPEIIQNGFRNAGIVNTDK